MDKEVVYIAHNNRIDVQLKASSAAYNLLSVTNITLTVGSKLVSGSSSGSSGYIVWAGASLSVGEVRLTLGSAGLTAGKYNAPLAVYDAVNTDGVIWGYIPMDVKADPEGELA